MVKEENQDELLKEEAEDLYQNAPCGYISILPDRTIAKINNVLLNWLGYTREELVLRKKFTDLISIGGKIYYETHHDPLQRMQGYVNELNYDFVKKDGTTMPCLLNSTIKKDGNGKILLARTTIFDISERKKYEKELLRSKKEADRAAKAKAQLLSVMSHEIRTPMNAIIGLSHLLLEEDPKSEQVENLRILKVSAENLLNLLNSILDYSKIEAGKIILDETDFAMQDLVTGIVNTLKIKGEEKGIKITINYDSSIPPVLNSDPVKITQILTNLIGNAIKFTHEGSVKIDVKLIHKDQGSAFINFSIIDSGVGISQENVTRIFNEFEQASKDTTREFGGTGLGLSITKKLVELFGSSIMVTSELGKGSTFTFALKFKISDKVLVRDSWGSKEIKTDSLKGIKVLIAEDNSVNVLVVSKFLKNWELIYDVASDGQEAFEKVQKHEYDLVLMDLQMPVMDGYETTEKIRALKDEQLKDLPIIALTASAIIGDNHKIFRIGMNDYVSKPFNPKDLYDKIYKYGSRKTSAQGYIQNSTNLNYKKHSSIINFNKYKILAEDDKDFLLTLTKETIQNFHTYRTEFRTTLKDVNLNNYKKQVHKIKLVSDVLEIKEIENILKTGCDLLEQKELKGIEKFTTDLDQFFQDIISELEVHFNKI
jgi:PAS domain S-box-containing protein